MNDSTYVARNSALEFAARTKVNLEFIEEARVAGSNVHVVTQLTNSLLGLIVFVWEKTFVDYLKTLQMKDLVDKGWPKIIVTKGTSGSLHEFVRHLRNAVAHGRITFSSDSSDPLQVAIQIDDCKPHERIPFWSASLKTSDLRQFCMNFTALLENTIG